MSLTQLLARRRHEFAFVGFRPAESFSWHITYKKQSKIIKNTQLITDLFWNDVITYLSTSQRGRRFPRKEDKVYLRKTPDTHSDIDLCAGSKNMKKNSRNVVKFKQNVHAISYLTKHVKWWDFVDFTTVTSPSSLFHCATQWYDSE